MNFYAFTQAKKLRTVNLLDYPDCNKPVGCSVIVPLY